MQQRWFLCWVLIRKEGGGGGLIGRRKLNRIICSLCWVRRGMQEAGRARVEEKGQLCPFPITRAPLALLLKCLLHRLCRRWRRDSVWNIRAVVYSRHSDMTVLKVFSFLVFGEELYVKVISLAFVFVGAWSRRWTRKLSYCLNAVQWSQRLAACKINIKVKKKHRKRA